MSQHASSSATGAGASSSSYTKYASLPDVDTSAPDVYEYEGPNRTNDAARSGRQRSRKQRSEGDDGAFSDSSSDDSDLSANRKHPGDGKGALNEDIDQSSLRRTDAASKFSGATDLPAERADFSGRLKTARSRKPKSARPRDAGLETSTYAMEGIAARGRESVVERLRRLKFEASQLEEELNASAGNLKVEATSKDEQVDGAEVLAQLKVLQDQLEKLPSPSAADTSVSGESALNQEAVRRLLQQVK